MKKTRYLGKRKPSRKEKTEYGADIVFMRETQNGNNVLEIWACISDSGAQQWGTSDEILNENVNKFLKWATTIALKNHLSQRL